MNGHTWKVSQVLNASIVTSALGNCHIARNMKGYTQKRRPTNVNNVISGFTSLLTANAMNEPTLKRSLTSAGIAINASVR